MPGISSKVLTQNLYELQRNGIIEKKVIQDQPEKTEYVLTEKGKDLRTVMMEMRTWGERWLIPPDKINKWGQEQGSKLPAELV